MSFAVLCAVSLLLWFGPLLNTLSLALGDEKYTHVLLILPLTAVLIFLQWNWHTVEFRPSIWSGGLLTFALLLAGLARWEKLAEVPDIQLSVSMLGLVSWWVGSFALCFGVRTSRTLLLPLAFLLWMVPIPAIVLNPLIGGLRQGSVVAAELLFSLARTPVSRQGLVLTIPGVELEVAPECSSIRSSLVLIVTAVALAQIVLRSSWRKLLVVAVAIPLSVAKNGLRIFTIGWLGTRVDEGFLDGRLHHHGGVVFFAIALAGIFSLLWLLRRGDSSGKAKKGPRDEIVLG
ncbi:MAG: exosortase [Acidobacteriia bacterium]|nr:exosortase [Terriglobia bacterium]